MRVSNFLLWEIAYSELWVTATLWPDFGRTRPAQGGRRLPEARTPIRGHASERRSLHDRDRRARGHQAALARRRAWAPPLLYGARRARLLWWGPLATGVVFGVMAGFAAAEFYAMAAPRGAAAERGLRRRRSRRHAGGRCAVGPVRAVGDVTALIAAFARVAHARSRVREPPTPRSPSSARSTRASCSPTSS